MINKETENIVKSIPNFLHLLSIIRHPYNKLASDDKDDSNGSMPIDRDQTNEPIIKDATGCLKTLWSFVILQSVVFHISLTPIGNLFTINEFIAQVFLAFLTIIFMSSMIHFTVYFIGPKSTDYNDRTNRWFPIFWATWAYTLLAFSILVLVLHILRRVKFVSENSSIYNSLFVKTPISPVENLKDISTLDNNFITVVIITIISVVISMYFINRRMQPLQVDVNNPKFSILWPSGLLSCSILFSFLIIN